jgi:hypothetical protein
MMSTDGFEDAPITNSDKRPWGEVKGGTTCSTRRGKRGEGERKERGCSGDRAALFYKGCAAERELGRWVRRGVAPRSRRGGPAAVARER